MRALILAAGRGSRLKPATDRFPKPLLRLDGVSLVETQYRLLASAGIEQVCINLNWLGEQIFKELQAAPNIRWQFENPVLGTGGAIAKALPWLCENDRSFILVNADIAHDFTFSQLLGISQGSTLVLIPTEQTGGSQLGDFGYVSGKVRLNASDYVYSGIAIIEANLFARLPQGDKASVFRLMDVIRPRIALGEISGLIHLGEWDDLGTPERCARYAERLTTPDGLRFPAN